MPSKRVTLKQIAEVAGVHATTVSMALRNHPRIPVATRERLRALAEKMGYVPDPMLSSLNAYRHGKQKRKYLSKIAWLNICVDPDWPRKTAFVIEYFKGAMERAKSLGYELNVFDAHPHRIPTRRLQQILLSRSISGIIVAPVQLMDPNSVNRLDLDWENFCGVTFGYSLEYPRINRVTSDHFHSVIEALRNLHALGYKRPGLFLSRSNNIRIDRLWEAGYLLGMRATFKSPALPVALYGKEQTREQEFNDWYQACTPDVVIAQDYASIEPCLQSPGTRLPADFTFVLLEQGKHQFPCINQNNVEIGATAASLLIGSLQRNERGIPAIPNVTLIQGTWSGQSPGV